MDIDLNHAIGAINTNLLWAFNANGTKYIIYLKLDAFVNLASLIIVNTDYSRPLVEGRAMFYCVNS